MVCNKFPFRCNHSEMYEMFCVVISGLTFVWVLSVDPGRAWLLSRLHSRNYWWVPILGQSCLATKISAPGPSSFGWFRHSGTVGVLSKLMQSLCTKFLVFHMEENKCPINHPAMPKCHPQRYKSTESSCKDWCFSWYDNSRAGRW